MTELGPMSTEKWEGQRAHFPHKSRHFLITSQMFSRSVNIYEIPICSKSPSFSWIQRQTILYCNYKWEQNSSILKDLGNNAGHRQASWRTKASLDQSIHANKDDNYTREQDCLYFIVVWGAVQQYETQETVHPSSGWWKMEMAFNSPAHVFSFFLEEEQISLNTELIGGAQVAPSQFSLHPVRV